MSRNIKSKMEASGTFSLKLSLDQYAAINGLERKNAETDSDLRRRIDLVIGDREIQIAKEGFQDCISPEDYERFRKENSDGV